MNNPIDNEEHQCNDIPIFDHSIVKPSNNHPSNQEHQSYENSKV